jgi:Cobalt transport protein
MAIGQIKFSPAFKLLCVLSVAVCLQSTVGGVLAVVLCLWAWVIYKARFNKLLRRVRLLVIVLFVVTLLMTPGTALFPDWGLYPTKEGCLLALTQLMRLMGMLATVCLLLGSTDDQDLAAGLLALLKPLSGNRQWPDRAVARLLLVFHYLEVAPKPRNLQEVLDLAGADMTHEIQEDAPEYLEIKGIQMSAGELAVGLVLLLISVMWLIWGAAL